MKFYLVTLVTAILFSSCLKQSIPDAMLGTQNSGGQGGPTATLSYYVNGNLEKLSVSDADSQDPNYYTLGCTKSNGYNFDALTDAGEFTFTFYSDSLVAVSYTHLTLPTILRV